MSPFKNGLPHSFLKTHFSPTSFYESLHIFPDSSQTTSAPIQKEVLTMNSNQQNNNQKRQSNQAQDSVQNNQNQNKNQKKNENRNPSAR